MSFQWPDLINGVADVVTISSIWIVYFQTRQAWKELKKARETQSVGHECLGFVDSNRGVGINLIPLATTPAIPRPGDIVSLPGEFFGNENPSAGTYEVESVHFIYSPAPMEVDQPGPALLSRINVNVREMTS
jgi:hypothetical protein